jgi:hypothetical protein
MFLKRYVEQFSSLRIFRRATLDHIPPLFFLYLILVSPLYLILPRKYFILPPLLFIFSMTLFRKQGLQTYSVSEDGCELIVHNPSLEGKSIPLHLFLDIAGTVFCRLLGTYNDSYYHDVKEIAGYVFHSCSPLVKLRLYSLDLHLPRKQILITNHTNSTIRDALSFFSFVPPTSKLLVVQHNFNKIVTLVAKYSWGAWTIDKDDKSPSGKRKLNQELQKIIDYMKTETDLTVVIYPQGRVPKSSSDCRNVGVFYPGAFYMSLMTGYFITPLINDFSDSNVFTLSLKPSLDLCSEYKGRFIDYPEVGRFRDDPQNKELLNIICERFRNLYQAEYDWITKTENG